MSQPLHKEKVIPDPVLSSFDLPLRRIIYPFGFPLQVETNSTDVIDAAVEGFGAFDQMFHETPVRLALGVLPGSCDALPLESVVRSREHLMSIFADSENFAMCDFNLGYSFGWVNENTAADHSLLRYRFLLSAGGTLVEQRAFSTLHGALLSRNGTGVMLAGDSFAGKSTLAYACARAGWTYISDDNARFVRDREDCYAVGDPHSIRFRPDAPDLFPELSDRLAMVRPNGKIAIEVRTRELGLNTAPGCHVEHVVYLNRQSAGQPQVRRISRERVRDDFSLHNILGTRDVREANRRCHERVLQSQLWELQYSDLDDAVVRLQQLVESGR